MIEIWFVRHGQTDWNLERRIQGWTDVPLNRNGTRQAQLLAGALQDIPFTTIYSSDLSRAINTAAILQAHLGVPLRVDDRLRERYFGSIEGTYRTENTHHNGQSGQIALASARPLRNLDVDDDRESDQEVSNRANSFLRSILETHQQGRILCVSHGGFIRVLLCRLGWPGEDPLLNTSVSKLAWSGRDWRIVGVNWADHLHT